MDILLLILIIIAILLLCFAVYFGLWTFRFIRPFFYFGGPFVASTWDRVNSMKRLAEITPEDVVVDLGSGEGRLTIMAAQEGAKRSVGYEIDAKLVKQSEKGALKAGVSDRTEFRKENFWNVDLSGYSVVLLYQITFVLTKIEKKFAEELRPGTRIITVAFKIPGWEIDAQDGDVYRYIVK